MISINIETHPDSPVQVVMQNHEVLATYIQLPPGTRLATAKDFFNEKGQYLIGKAYFWKRMYQDYYNASRTTTQSWDTDFKGAIIGKRVWILEQ